VFDTATTVLAVVGAYPGSALRREKQGAGRLDVLESDREFRGRGSCGWLAAARDNILAGNTAKPL